MGLTSASIKDDNATRLSNLGIQAGTANSYLVVFDERWFNYLGDDMRNAHTYTPNPEQLSLLDWQDEFFRNSIVQDYSLNVSGWDGKHILFILRWIYESGWYRYRYGI